MRSDGGINDLVPRCIFPNDLDEVLNKTALLWEDMRGRQLFLTGGSGFFGRWLIGTFCHINRVLGLNARATVLTRSRHAFLTRIPWIAAEASVTLLEGDVSTFRFPEGDFHFVIHAATDSGGRQSLQGPLTLLTVMVEGTRRVLEFAISHKARRFLLTSSGAVYGRQPRELRHLSEDFMGGPDPLKPGSVYGEGKRCSELLCSLYDQREQMDCLIARCWTFCGPCLPLDAHFAIGNFIGDALEGRPILVKGDGTTRRSYLYAGDLTTWLWTILFKAPSLVPINVGSSHDISILEAAQAVDAILESRTGIIVTSKPLPDALPERYVPSVARAKDLLGLEQTVSLEQTIARTVAWHRAI